MPGALPRRGTRSRSPAWKKGVQPGWVITEIGGTKHPFFDNLKVKVMLSSAGSRIRFVFVDPHDPEKLHVIELEPRRTPNDDYPVIGVAPPL